MYNGDAEFLFHVADTLIVPPIKYLKLFRNQSLSLGIVEYQEFLVLHITL